MMRPIRRETEAIIKPTTIRRLPDFVAQSERNENRKKRLKVKPMTPIEAPANLFWKTNWMKTNIATPKAI
ncbi:MAG: hypothetical protein WC833_11865 [Bacteroidales bacterium]|jgi:hypothetical protein